MDAQKLFSVNLYLDYVGCKFVFGLAMSVIDEQSALSNVIKFV